MTYLSPAVVFSRVNIVCFLCEWLEQASLFIYACMLSVSLVMCPVWLCRIVYCSWLIYRWLFRMLHRMLHAVCLTCDTCCLCSQCCCPQCCCPPVLLPSVLLPSVGYCCPQYCCPQCCCPQYCCPCFVLSSFCKWMHNTFYVIDFIFDCCHTLWNFLNCCFEVSRVIVHYLCLNRVSYVVKHGMCQLLKCDIACCWCDLSLQSNCNLPNLFVDKYHPGAEIFASNQMINHLKNRVGKIMI